MNLYLSCSRLIISCALIVTCYNSASIETYFSPADHIQEKLIDRIQNEKKSIKAALYLIFDKKVVEALCQAAQDGVSVEIIADVENTEYKWGQIPVLHEAGITVHIYNAKQGILHDKFFLFECNKNNKPAVWTGSYNITVAADRFNRENVVVIGDEYPTLRSFEKEFELIKKNAKPYPSRTRKSFFCSDFSGDNVIGRKLKERPRF